MKNFKELSAEELQKISGGAWPLIVKVGAWIVGACATAVAGYYAVEAVEGIEDGLSDDCCDCECK
jgi:lactobin A/cerein 7B family class IIb bacteriocin